MNITRFFIKLIPVGKIKYKLLEKYCPDPDPLVINKNTKCLVVAPHPDDETIACGGMMMKYAHNFDCVVMASCGIANNKVTAEKNADVRMSEFKSVMNKLKIKNAWVFKTFGVPPMYNQIKKHLKDYLDVLDTLKYDYIFVPHPDDGHQEHRYISRIILKKILRKNGYKKNLQICFYDVWRVLKRVNHYEDISGVANKKYDLLKLYKSQNNVVYYPDMADGLSKMYGAFGQKNMRHAEAFFVVPVQKYLRGKK